MRNLILTLPFRDQLQELYKKYVKDLLTMIDTTIDADATATTIMNFEKCAANVSWILVRTISYYHLDSEKNFYKLGTSCILYTPML